MLGYDDYYSIDHEAKGINVLADNQLVIPSLDLSLYTVIDCDAYGCPYDQIKAVFDNKTLHSGTVVFFTFIISKIRNISNQIKSTYQIPGWLPVCLASGLQYWCFLDLLKFNGIDDTTSYRMKNKSQDKIYGYFVTP